MDHQKEDSAAQEAILEEDPTFGWSFHKWPFLIALGITILLYLVIFLFVDPNPPYFDPASLPPPPGAG